MSHTMKPEEAIRALAFLSNADELTSVPESIVIPDSDGFGSGLRGKLTKLVSERALDLYAMSTDSKTLSKTTSSTAASDSETGGSSYKSVSFGVVEVRKYPITIGANPSVSRGVPRTIEWDHLEDETERHHINAYERTYPERKRGEELLLDGVTRAKMLQDLGFTKTQLMEGIKKVKQYRIWGNPER